MNTSTKKKIEVFDPALCCSTGVCGPAPDSALSEFASTVKQLQNEDTVVRYNLAQEPGAFAENTIVKKILETDGPDALPVILVDGELVMKGVYPTAAQLQKIVEQAADCCGSDEDCCGDDEDCCTEETSQKESDCCGGSSCC